MDWNILEEYDTFIFDFDGTLIDSEPYNRLAHSIVLSRILNKDITLSVKDYEKYVGKTDAEIYEMFKKEFAVDFDSSKMATEQAVISRDYLLSDEVKVHDYFLKLAKNKGNKHFYVASNHHEIGLFPVLEKKGIMDYLDNVFCLSKMGIKKENFYKNIQEYIPSAKKMVVFEDDARVLEFLKDNGYAVVAIQNKENARFVEGKYPNVVKV